MKSLKLAAAFAAALSLLAPAVLAQSVDRNPPIAVKTQPSGTATNAAASTAFVADAVSKKLSDAPIDGSLYGRQNGTWTAVPASTGGGAPTSTQITTALGYMPVSKSGDALTGGLTVPSVTYGANTVGPVIRAFPNRPDNQFFAGGSGAQWSDCNTFVDCNSKTTDTQFVQVLSRMRKQHTDADDYNVSLDNVTFKGNMRPWQASHRYDLIGEHATWPAPADGVVSNLYVVTATGTSAASGGIAGTGTSIADGSVTWKYERVSPNSHMLNGTTPQTPNNAEMAGFSNLCQFGQDGGHGWCEVRNTIMLPDYKGDFAIGKEHDFGNYAYGCADPKGQCYADWWYGLTSFPLTSIMMVSTPPNTPEVGPGAPWHANTDYAIQDNNTRRGAPVVSNAGHTWFLVTGGHSGSAGPSGSDPQAIVQDGTAQWRMYDAGLYYGSPNHGGAAYYGLAFQGANLIQHSNISDGTHAYYGILADYGAVHGGATYFDRSSSPIAMAFGGNYSSFGIEDTSTAATFQYIHGAHSFAGVYDTTSGVAFRSAGSHSTAAFYDASTTPTGLALGGAYSFAQISGNGFSVGPTGALTATTASLTGTISAFSGMNVSAGQLLCLGGVTDCWSASGNSTTLTAGAYAAFAVNGGNPNGIRIDTAGANFPPALNVTGPDANMSMLVNVKGTGNFTVSNGTVACSFTPTTGGSTWACPSDERLKTDIVGAKPALPSLLDMKIHDYTEKATGAHRTSVIAQELQKTHPDMVHKGQDGLLSVDAPNPWVLVKAIQELKAENDNMRLELRAAEALGALGLAGLFLVRRRRAT